MSQCYTFEPNKYRGSTKTILYISKGGRPNPANNQSGAAGQQQPSPGAGSNQSVSALGSVSAQIADFAGPSTVGSSSPRQRLSMCACYICKEKLGADNSKRVGMYIILLGLRTFLYWHWLGGKICVGLDQDRRSVTVLLGMSWSLRLAFGCVTQVFFFETKATLS